MAVYSSCLTDPADSQSKSWWPPGTLGVHQMNHVGTFVGASALIRVRNCPGIVISCVTTIQQSISGCWNRSIAYPICQSVSVGLSIG